MKIIYWKDKNNNKHASLVRDQDPSTEEFAKKGIPYDPPAEIVDILESAKEGLMNTLVTRGILSYNDIVNNPDSVSNAILSVLRKPIIIAYKEAKKNKIYQGTKVNNGKK